MMSNLVIAVFICCVDKTVATPNVANDIKQRDFLELSLAFSTNRQ